MRRCPRCQTAFVKEKDPSGKNMYCNKMTCRCGLTMCYICRETDINYAHFCPYAAGDKLRLDANVVFRHVRNPDNPYEECEQCEGPTCLLWEDPDPRDEAVMEAIKVEHSQLADDDVVSDAATAGSGGSFSCAYSLLAISSLQITKTELLRLHCHCWTSKLVLVHLLPQSVVGSAS